jgi:hypothetical protein
MEEHDATKAYDGNWDKQPTRCPSVEPFPSATKNKVITRGCCGQKCRDLDQELVQRDDQDLRSTSVPVAWCYHACRVTGRVISPQCLPLPFNFHFPRLSALLFLSSPSSSTSTTTKSHGYFRHHRIPIQSPSITSIPNPILPSHSSNTKPPSVSPSPFPVASAYLPTPPP